MASPENDPLGEVHADLVSSLQATAHALMALEDYRKAVYGVVEQNVLETVKPQRPRFEIRLRLDLDIIVEANNPDHAEGLVWELLDRSIDIEHNIQDIEICDVEPIE